MGLFDSLISTAISQIGAGHPMMGSLANLVMQREGGLNGLVQNFQNQGLGNVVGSWVGTGQNLPVSADQLQNVLGQGRIAEIAQSMGISHGEALQQLTQTLPHLVDQLTPNGHIDGGFVQQALGALLQK